ncbi:MAG TPA: heparan-alpha-glucosaminide N-acetyltransferase domain-containing protein [Terriglobales bacterium]|jgi:uncharacterized membrane protein
MPPAAPSRISYIDWLRGLACLVMFQTHCYDAWLGGNVRKGSFFMWSRIGGTLPAPLFLFLAGISTALVAERLQKKNVLARSAALTTMRRGAEVLGLGLLFRLQEFVIGWGWAPWTDLLRVDVLNTIGVAIILMGALLFVFSGRSSEDLHLWPREKLIVSAAAVAAVISLATPLLWTSTFVHNLPWPIETYINGVHNTGKPVGGLFPIFPWVGFAFAGLAIGFLLQMEFIRQRETQFFVVCGMLGVGGMYFSRWLTARPWHIYTAFDYWHTSPEFFLCRVGLLMIVLSVGYLWCKWGAGAWKYSPLVQMGKTSLMVYWVHIEFVYGRFSILPRRALGIGGASIGLAVIFIAMWLLSLARTRWKNRNVEPHALFRKPVNAV